MEFPLWDLSRKPEFGSRIQPHQEANHDTAEAEKSSHEFGSFFPPEEFEYDAAHGNEERFRDRAEQALKHSV
jgi:hypothetical protein